MLIAVTLISSSSESLKHLFLSTQVRWKISPQCSLSPISTIPSLWNRRDDPTFQTSHAMLRHSLEKKTEWNNSMSSKWTLWALSDCRIKSCIGVSILFREASSSVTMEIYLETRNINWSWLCVWRMGMLSVHKKRPKSPPSPEGILKRGWEYFQQKLLQASENLKLKWPMEFEKTQTSFTFPNSVECREAIFVSKVIANELQIPFPKIQKFSIHFLVSTAPFWGSELKNS